MGNLYLRALSERIHLVAAPDTWIEGAAIQQLETTAKLKGMQAVLGLPDLHPGRGYPIGAVFFTGGLIYPALIGGDIGCGMQLWQTHLQLHTLKINKIEKQLKNLHESLTEEERLQLDDSATIGAPGTIGGGNHFAELQQVDAVYDTAVFEKNSLNQQQLFLLVHSGSRGYGGKILSHAIQTYGHKGIEENNPFFEEYLRQHDHALAFAQENRKLIALRILHQLKTAGTPVLDLWHNSVTSASFNNVQGWLHRKGAAPADQGLAIIPGSRGNHSYLVMPNLGSDSAQALNSIAHGAGRKWMRSECKEKLKKYNIEQLKRSEFGSRLICDMRELIYEEAPQAYKSIDSVIHALECAGLIRKIARLKPVITYKCREG